MKDIDLITVFSSAVAFTFLDLYLHNVENVMKVYIILRLFKYTFKYQKDCRGMRIQGAKSNHSATIYTGRNYLTPPPEIHYIERNNAKLNREEDPQSFTSASWPGRLFYLATLARCSQLSNDHQLCSQGSTYQDTQHPNFMHASMHTGPKMIGEWMRLCVKSKACLCRCKMQQGGFTDPVFNRTNIQCLNKRSLL